jgi:hypothetical protein
MSVQTMDIERVVREVLAELGAVRKNSTERPAVVIPERPATVVAEGAGAQSPAPQSQAGDSNHNGDLVVTSRVVTMLDVSGRLDAARRLIVSREAIVTPAVRDELLRRGMTLAYGDSSNGRTAAPVRLVVMTAGTDFDPAALAAGLAREGLNVEHSASDCIISATDQLAAEIGRSGTLGVLLTRHTAAGMCLANRLRGVRAVTGGDAPAVALAAAAVGANLLVIDPEAGTFFQLRQMASEFCRLGMRSCPGPFLTRLA